MSTTQAQRREAQDIAAWHAADTRRGDKAVHQVLQFLFVLLLAVLGALALLHAMAPCPEAQLCLAVMAAPRRWLDGLLRRLLLWALRLRFAQLDRALQSALSAPGPIDHDLERLLDARAAVGWRIGQIVSAQAFQRAAASEGAA